MRGIVGRLPRLLRTGVMPGRAGLVKYLSVALLSAGLLVQVPAAHAQYDKQDWPAKQALPALKASDQSGKVWDLKALRGRPVLINFWATWCGPCKEELPSLQSLADNDKGLAQGAMAPIVLAVNVKEPPARVLQFVQTQGVRLPVLMDPQGELARQFGVNIYPTTVLVSASGKARWRVLGSLDWTDAEASGWISQLYDKPRR